MTDHLHSAARHYQPRELVYCERCGAISASEDACLCCAATNGLYSVEEILRRDSAARAGKDADA